MFPKNSAFHDEERRREAIEAGAGMPPLRTPEQNREAAIGQNRAIISIPAHVFEQWIRSIELIENDGDAHDVADQLRSYLP